MPPALLLLTSLCLVAVGIALGQSLFAASASQDRARDYQLKITTEETSAPTILLSVQKIDLTQLQANAKLVLTVPHDIQQQIASDLSTLKITLASGPGLDYPGVSYLNESLTPISLLSGPTYSVLTSPSKYYMHEYPAGAKDSMVLNLKGSSESYPQDGYEFYVSFLAQYIGNNPMSLVFGTMAPWSAEYFDNNNGFSVISPNNNGPIKGVHLYSYYATLSWHRRLWYVAYVYVVSLIPLLFAMLFLHLLFFSEKYRDKELQDLFVGIVAAVVAVLPLRAILVPPSIAGVTRVDFILAFGLVAIVAVCVARYARDSWMESGTAGNAGNDGVSQARST